jgi:hypothetical protein
MSLIFKKAMTGKCMAEKFLRLLVVPLLSLNTDHWLLDVINAFAEQNAEINSDFILPPTDRNNPTDKHNNR